MGEKSQDVKTMASQALENDEALSGLIESLSGASRRSRQLSASALALVSKEAPEKLIEHTGAIVDSLNRPEAQTRWESLDILTVIVGIDSRICDKGLAGAEMALFDEDSGPVRLAALRFLCALGSTTENRSEKVWPLLDEAIQCYHGDPEFQDMLIAVCEFSSGKLSLSVKENLAARMKFDAESGKGALKRRAQAIIDNVS